MTLLLTLNCITVTEIETVIGSVMTGESLYPRVECDWGVTGGGSHSSPMVSGGVLSILLASTIYSKSII